MRNGVPIERYHEWRQENGVEQPDVVHKEGDCMLLADLWDSWIDRCSFTAQLYKSVFGSHLEFLE